MPHPGDANTGNGLFLVPQGPCLSAPSLQAQGKADRVLHNQYSVQRCADVTPVPFSWV